MLSDKLLVLPQTTSFETQIEQDPRIKSDHSKRQYRSNLQAFEDWRAGRTVTKILVEQYAAELQEQGLAPATINQKLASIRWWVRRLSDIAQDGGFEKADVIAKVAGRIMTVSDVKGQRPESGRHITPGELDSLLRACKTDTSPSGQRNIALIALAYATGLRRDELANLTMDDLSLSGDTLDIRVVGKGDKIRTVYINNGALLALNAWLNIRGDNRGSVFCTIRKGGKITYGKLSGEAMRLILEKLEKQAKLSKAITWHDFRRTFAGNLFDAGIDGVIIQKLMGHSTLTQTGRYDRRPEEARRQAIKVLHVPYYQKG